MTNATSRLRQVARSPQLAIRILVALAIIVVAIGVPLAVSRVRSNTRNGPDSTIVVAGQTTTLKLARGAQLIIPPGALPPGTTIQAKYGGEPTGTWDEMKPIGAPIELASDRPNSVHGPLTLEFPVPASEVAPDVDPAVQFGIATYDQATKKWTPVASTYDADSHMVVAQIPHFSWWNPFTWDFDALFAHVAQDFGQLVGGRAGSPSCSGVPPAWVGNLAGITNDADVSIRSCVQAQGNVLDVEMVNNRAYGQVLTYGGTGVKWAWHENGTSLSGIALDHFMDANMLPNQLYLPPLGHASIGINDPAANTTTDFHIGPTQISIGADFLAYMLGQGVDVLPDVGKCASVDAGAPLLDVSVGALRDDLVAVAGCVEQGFTHLLKVGALDKVKVSELAALFGKIKAAAVLADGIALAGGVTWKLADLIADNWVIARNLPLGNGFSVYTKATAQPPSGSARPGQVLYTADWSHGLDGWSGTPDWHASGGMLVDDGTNGVNLATTPSLTGPIDLGTNPDYTITASIAVTQQGFDPGFGMFVRYTRPDQGYIIGLNDGYNADNPQMLDISVTRADSFYSPIVNVPFVPDTSFHTYSIEVHGSKITVSVDGTVYAAVDDSSYASGASIGFWDKDVQLQIRSLTVVAG